jgi:TRAP transporter TAXI family solute receptor
VKAFLIACGVTAADINTWREIWTRVSFLMRMPEVGSVRDALAREADAALTAATARSGLPAEEILSRLVELATLDDNGQYAGRRLPYNPDDPTESAWIIVLRVFIDRDLLTTGTAENGDWVAAANQEFFVAWPLLTAALRKHDHKIRSIRSVERAAAEWRQAGRTSPYLWNADRLAAIAGVEKVRSLSDDGRDFMAAAQSEIDVAQSKDRARRRRNIAGLAGLCIVSLLAVTSSLWQWSAARSDENVPSQSEKLGRCGGIDIFTGHIDSPYYRYAQVLKRRIEVKYPESAVAVQHTSGTSDNINRLRDPVAASCELSVVQLNVGLDARNGRDDFMGKPLEELRTVGPLWFDLIHLVVRRNSSIHTAADLCGRTVATGVGLSGVKQIGEVLFRQIDCDTTPGVTQERAMLPDGLDRLRAGTVDAVLWAGGSPTRIITNAIDGGLAVRLVPLDDYLTRMQDDWSEHYPGSGDIFQVEQINADDYPGVDRTDTVAVPNGVAVSNTADPEMVRFVAESLVRDRTDFEYALWDDVQGTRHFLDAPRTVAGSKLYCAVPLHPAAAAYYRELSARPPCGD